MSLVIAVGVAVAHALVLGYLGREIALLKRELKLDAPGDVACHASKSWRALIEMAWSNPNMRAQFTRATGVELEHVGTSIGLERFASWVVVETLSELEDKLAEVSK